MPTARARWVANGDTSTLCLFPPTGLMVIFK
jgi:hypothetical protein